MSSLYEFLETPDLDSPVLILSLEGWIDAGRASARAAAALLDGIESTTIARFDTDSLLDHRARRPIMHLRDGLNTGLSWPSIDLVAFSDPGGNDVLALTGFEPDHQWRSFTTAVVDLALEMGVRMVVGLGAYPVAVPHTRPSALASTATDPILAAHVGNVRSTLDVPAGIGGAIEERCAQVGLPAVGIWAQVPHYAAAMPYPRAALALVEKVNELGGFTFPTGTLAEEADTVTTRLNELVADSDEHVELLRQLEAQADHTGVDESDAMAADQQLPSGDDLAGEIERFLRDQGGR
ncbi:MAG: proteasome assembly chaperone family protein [Acidimicrobiales bacterium]